jgi:hypothetical protein
MELSFLSEEVPEDVKGSLRLLPPTPHDYGF